MARDGIYPAEDRFMLKRGVFHPVAPDVRHGLEFSAPSQRSCENEVKALLVALVLLLKPDLVVEFGVAEGYTLAAMSEALLKNANDKEANGRVGKIVGIDLNPPSVPIGPLSEFWQQDFHDFASDQLVDLAFLDATRDEKDEEVMSLAPYMRRGGFIVMHNVGMGRGNPIDLGLPRRGEIAFRRVPQHLYNRVSFRTPAGLALLEWLGD